MDNTTTEGTMKIKIRYQDDSDGQGWVAWVSDARGWQPIISWEDPDNVPTLDAALDCDPVTYLDPDDYDGVDVVEA
jgi:hypothetical protein